MIDAGHATLHHRVNVMAQFGSLVVFRGTRQPGGECFGAATKPARLELLQFPSLPQYHGGFSASHSGAFLLDYEGLLRYSRYG